MPLNTGSTVYTVGQFNMLPALQLIISLVCLHMYFSLHFNYIYNISFAFNLQDNDTSPLQESLAVLTVLLVRTAQLLNGYRIIIAALVTQDIKICF